MNSPHRIRLAGVIWLVAGLIAASVIFATAQPEEKPGILGVDLPTNRDTMQLERMGGKSYILFHEFSEWFASLWHGRKLAYTIGVIAIGGFLGSRWLADFLAYEAAAAAKAPKA